MSPTNSRTAGLWAAPTATRPISATVVLPGSKSQTSRAFVIGTIAQNPTRISGGLASRDTYLAARAMVDLGATLVFEDEGDLVIEPPQTLQGGATIDCGQAGTVMRFGSALAAFADGKTKLICDPTAEARPIGPLMDSLSALGAKVRYGKRKGYLPVSITGIPARKRKPQRSEDDEWQVLIDTSSSSQFLSALLLTSPLIETPTVLRAEGRLPSWPYVAMSLEMLQAQGVNIQQTSSWSWRTNPTRPVGNPIQVEPDLANAGPFLAAAVLAGGSLTVRDWPTRTDQVGRYWVEILPKFGASVAMTAEGLTVTAPPGLTWSGVDLDLGPYGELAPTVAALCVFATSPSTLRGIAHLRGHETDRLAAMATEIRRLGAEARVLHDGIHIIPAPLRAAQLATYEDHRMATFAAIVGLRVPGCLVENIGTTAKTLPQFTTRWQAMLDGTKSPLPLTMEEIFKDPNLIEGSD
ncbi:3-phosphoshikimate 1-carboxyvinyltransferase [Actinomyces minihominis]|uniref:3-phosphoshikimate 1-carboxyvinyltransferase n=1 Tax=Actinomyces minihominis TaxID=2002838 RepID=UPI000C06BA8E|nr:3-phosphoshikimate 1-carboxyvinyltransferase [Actinomyces minihominis]